MEDFAFLKEAQQVMNDQKVPTTGRLAYVDGAIVELTDKRVIFSFGDSSIEYQKGSIFDPEFRNLL